MIAVDAGAGGVEADGGWRKNIQMKTWLLIDNVPPPPVKPIRSMNGSKQLKKSAASRGTFTDNHATQYSPVRFHNVTDRAAIDKCQEYFLNWFRQQQTYSSERKETEGRRDAAGGPGSDYDKCHTLNHMFLLKLSDRPKEDLWADGIFVLPPPHPTGVDVDAPWHSQHQFKHSWPAQGNSSTFIRNAKVTLKMQFINPRQWTVFFILLWKINVIELESCQRWLLLRSRGAKL